MKSNQDRLEKFDEEIDAALKLLSEAQPPAAMASRVHRSLETAAAGTHRATSGGLVWIPATGCAIAVILLVVFSQLHGTRAKQTSSVEMAKMAANMPATRGIAAGRPTLAPAGSSERREPSSQPAGVERSRQERPHYRHVANLLSYPLTRQEKLLVRFAETAKPADLQALNPEYQAKVETQQEAEFAAYLRSGDDIENNFGKNTTTEAAQSNQT
jgi:hypothetical protein